MSVVTGIVLSHAAGDFINFRAFNDRLILRCSQQYLYGVSISGLQAHSRARSEVLAVLNAALLLGCEQAVLFSDVVPHYVSGGADPTRGSGRALHRRFRRILHEVFFRVDNTSHLSELFGLGGGVPLHPALPVACHRELSIEDWLIQQPLPSSLGQIGLCLGLHTLARGRHFGVQGFLRWEKVRRDACWAWSLEVAPQGSTLLAGGAHHRLVMMRGEDLPARGKLLSIMILVLVVPPRQIPD